MKTDIVIFGAGCFWCIETIFSSIKGVNKVTPGYSGGKTVNPTYEEVCAGNTGHAEVCRIEYNPGVVSFEQLLKVFWKVHDPTTLNRQGSDIGTQYRSVIFYLSEEQKKIAKEIMQSLNKEKIWNNPIVTQIVALEYFYPAENYHHDYYRKNPDNKYCSLVVTPKVEKFNRYFKSILK